MKLKELLEMCDNINLETNVMVFATVEDYECDTPYWQSFTAEQLQDCESAVAKFKISAYQNLFVVALA